MQLDHDINRVLSTKYTTNQRHKASQYWLVLIAIWFGGVTDVDADADTAQSHLAHNNNNNNKNHDSNSKRERERATEEIKIKHIERRVVSWFKYIVRWRVKKRGQKNEWKRGSRR